MPYKYSPSVLNSLLLLLPHWSCLLQSVSRRSCTAGGARCRGAVPYCTAALPTNEYGTLHGLAVGAAREPPERLHDEDST